MHGPKHRLRAISGISTMSLAWALALALATGALALGSAQPLEARTTLQQATAAPAPTAGVAPNNPGSSDAVPGGAPQANQAGQPAAQGAPAQQQGPTAPPLVFLALMVLMFAAVLAFSFKARQDAVR